MTPLAALDSLNTPRLLLRASDPAFAPATAAFYARNRTVHAQWNPPLPEALFSTEGQHQRLAEAATAAAIGSGLGWWLFTRDAPDVAVGQIHFTQIARRAFCNAMLGYAVDSAHEGRGLMREALQAALGDAFGPRVGLHRVQANVRPENTRSLGPARSPGLRARRPGTRVPVHRRRLARPCHDGPAPSALAERPSAANLS